MNAYLQAVWQRGRGGKEATQGPRRVAIASANGLMGRRGGHRRTGTRHEVEDEEAEVMSSLVFFTAISKVAPRDFKVSFLELAGNLRNWVVTSLDCTAYQTGLPISIKADATGKKVKESSLIS